MVGVVGDADGHAAGGRRLQRRGHAVPGLAGQADVIEGQVERPGRSIEEAGHALGHLERGLPAGVERQDLDHEAKRKPVAAGSISSGL